MVSSTRGLADEHRLEAPGQGGVLLDVLAVLVERGGADAVQRAAGQLRLEQVGGVHRAVRLAGADQRVHLVDEQDDLAGADLRSPSARPSAAPRTRRGIWRRRPCAPRSSAITRLLRSASGTSPLTMRRARPSTMAVLPTPGSPISTGLFLVRRASTWMARRISSSRPITGSSLPSRASAVTSRAYFFSASKFSSAFGAVDLAALADVGDGLVQRLRRGTGLAQRRARPACPTGGERQQQPVLGDVFVAGLRSRACWRWSSTRTSSGVTCGWPAPLPCTLGCRAISASTAVWRGFGSPPAARIRPAAAPSSSSSSALSRCSGVRRWWYSRMAMVWARLQEALGAIGEFLDVHVSVPFDAGDWPGRAPRQATRPRPSA